MNVTVRDAQTAAPVEPPPLRQTEGSALSLQGLNAWYGKFHAVRDVSLEVPRHKITALIGPSGSGKSTVLRCINRIHETIPGARVSDMVLLEGTDIYREANAGEVRRAVGMVFQRPNPLATKSIYDNVAVGLSIARMGKGKELREQVESALRRAAIWEEVKDKLDDPATSLSGGQQQRLCIARALAVQPDVLLLDEPASALDPISTLKIEDLMQELKETVTIVIVTHNMQQAARASDQVAVLMMGEDKAGELVEVGSRTQVFTTPQDPRTEAYITGRIG
ncbi:MAG: phosphate ABC transporter ATP-binding protein [Chloroflexi bacterium]|nr:phosphate ABC transporter ATP-binding protein [Chloroflexota bacterium]